MAKLKLLERMSTAVSDPRDPGRVERRRAGGSTATGRWRPRPRSAGWRTAWAAGRTRALSKLLVAYPRPADIDAGKHSRPMLKLLVERLRWCDRHGVGYMVGLARNKVLE